MGSPAIGGEACIVCTFYVTSTVERDTLPHSCNYISSFSSPEEEHLHGETLVAVPKKRV